MRLLLILPVAVWLLIFVAAPAAMLAVIAFSLPADSVPPIQPALSLDAFTTALTDPLFREAAWGSLRLAAFSTLFCLLLGYPMALALARTAPSRRAILVALLMLPFWTSFLLRILAWIGILRDEGLLNAALLALGLIRAPLHLLYTDGASLIGIVYCYLPFLILPLQARLVAADPALEDAAADLGATPLGVFWHVTLPQSLPGVLAGCALVFVPVAGEYVIPALLGAPDTLTLGRAIWDGFFEQQDWPLAAALSLILLAVLLSPALLVRQARA
jgi:putrescine transport system permease protein